MPISEVRPMRQSEFANLERLVASAYFKAILLVFVILFNFLVPSLARVVIIVAVVILMFIIVLPAF